MEQQDVFDEDGKPMTKAERQWREAVEPIRRYAAAPTAIGQPDIFCRKILPISLALSNKNSTFAEQTV